MTKSERVVFALREKHSFLRYETMQSVRFYVITANDGYCFVNGDKNLILPMTSYCYRSNDYNISPMTKKVISDMIIDRCCQNLVGHFEYTSNDGDIFCEYGCVYSKKGIIYCISVKNTNTGNIKIIINSIYKNSDFLKCVIKSLLSAEHVIYDEIVIGSITDYIK